MILCFDAWINKSTFWSSKNNKKYQKSGQKSIQKMMRAIKKNLPKCCRKQGWKNPKFHLLLHYIDMIVAYGSPKNYDAQRPEHNHKYTAKIPGRRSQKTNVASEFECQVANRVSEAMIIDELHYIINDIDKKKFVCDYENDDDSIITQSTKIETSI